MLHLNPHPKKEGITQYAPIFGVVLVVSGLLLFLDQRIKTDWLSASIPLFVSIILIGAAIYLKKLIWLLPSLGLLGLSSFLFVMIQKLFMLDLLSRLAIGFGVNGFVWLAIFLSLFLIRKTLPWWSLFIAAACFGLFIVFLLRKTSLLDFVMYLSVPLGLTFVVWGLVRKNIGLVIPGLLVSTIANGIYMGWSGHERPNGLRETGIMLVWFSLGWILITVFSRIIKKKFRWWPLIPGGVLLMVGSGLYIGGNPGNTLGFLGNTGSIGLILFGIYLILLKFGMNNKD